MNLDQQINRLTPGETLTIGSYNGVTTKVERSGKGDRLTFFRETANGFTVFKICSF